MLYGQSGEAFPAMPDRYNINIGTSFDEFERKIEIKDRRLHLNGLITDIDVATDDFNITSSTAGTLVEQIVEFNRADAGIKPEDRAPIRLYINSPGGDLVEGFALVSTIELSKTPVYTINMGQWSSMAFLIGIAGHKRFSLPNATFLMHDGTSGAFGSSNKVQDRVKFEGRFEEQVVKPFVLKHSLMDDESYDRLARVELYMLPEDALEKGFIDKIVDDIDEIF